MATPIANGAVLLLYQHYIQYTPAIHTLHWYNSARYAKHLTNFQWFTTHRYLPKEGHSNTVGCEVITIVTMKSASSPTFQTKELHPSWGSKSKQARNWPLAPCMLPVWLIPQPWIRRQYVPLKCQWISTRPHGVTLHYLPCSEESKQQNWREIWWPHGSKYEVSDLLQCEAK